MDMSCHECRELMVPYLLSELSAEQAARVEQHVADCARCATRLTNEKVLQSTFADRYAIPDPSPDFETRVLAAARPDAARKPGHRGWSTPVVGGAVAAAMALGIALGVGLKPGSEQSQPVIAANQAEVNESLATPSPAVIEPVMQTVRLAFSSGQPLEDVTLTLELPANVELATFPGRQQLSWKVDLEQGENVLALPLRVLFPGAGELVAHIDDGQRQKTFRAAIPGQTKADNTEPAS
ncbi:transmembrane anti-sigma factor [Marinobacter lipolyticus SM19]|uniref:Transmembrane anti-sigma factor n=1 Tax=Marinobacter lipolyticus SM19 TaxID=1318628 RepID=R8AXP2_9GAMM|nr:zf-HC2 domain-containing protein [Marinobacter lipolyticus]EON91099.1 transmembrane anti-sigma factor [Marinobacter lipolyticus SM19]